MPVNYKVIQEIEILREFSAGILADINRRIDDLGENEQDTLRITRNLTEIIYKKIYSISSIEQVLVVRGKLQLINEILKRLADCNSIYGISTETFSNEQFIDKASAILRLLTTSCTQQVIPKAYILGGQPGAGKTCIITILYTLLQGNVVIISGDDFRNWHPNYAGLREKYGDKYVDKTAEFSGKVTEYMIEKCSDQKLNLIIEGTLRTAEVPLKTERLLKSKGYETELAIMAVNPKLSYIGTLTRYEKMMEIGTVARQTEKEHHDKVIDGIAANINVISSEQQFDNITLYNRQGTCLYNKKTDPEIDLHQILKQEHNRDLSQVEIMDCKEQLETVIEHMWRRNDSRLSEVKCFNNMLT